MQTLEVFYYKTVALFFTIFSVILSGCSGVSAERPDTIALLGEGYALQSDYSLVRDKALDQKEVNCLAKTLYFEARSEPLVGQYAVGYVVLNRVEDDRFPDTICGVVKQGLHRNGKPVVNRCQFSWYCQASPAVIRKPELYAKMQEVAKEVMREKAKNPIGKNLFFHANYVKVNHKRKIATKRIIGGHTFYAYQAPRPRNKLA